MASWSRRQCRDRPRGLGEPDRGDPRHPGSCHHDARGGAGTDPERRLPCRMGRRAAHAVYCATKNGVRAFSLAAEAELKGTPVHIRCLLPDGIRTPMVDVTDARHVMSFTGARLLEPDEVAAAGAEAPGRQTAAGIGAPPPWRHCAAYRAVPLGRFAAPGPDRSEGSAQPAAGNGSTGATMNDPRTVFITGAAGFMGHALSERFRADDWTDAAASITSPTSRRASSPATSALRDHGSATCRGRPWWCTPRRSSRTPPSTKGGG